MFFVWNTCSWQFCSDWVWNLFVAILPTVLLRSMIATPAWKLSSSNWRDRWSQRNRCISSFIKIKMTKVKWAWTRTMHETKNHKHMLNITLYKQHTVAVKCIWHFRYKIINAPSVLDWNSVRYVWEALAAPFRYGVSNHKCKSTNMINTKFFSIYLFDDDFELFLCIYVTFLLISLSLHLQCVNI